LVGKKLRRQRSKGIAETYIRIADVPHGLNKEKARQYLEQHAYIWAERYFKKSVVVKVRVEEGSLIVWVLVSGMTLFTIVSGYGSFRSGIDHIVSDAKAFSSHVIEAFGRAENIPDAAILRAERRLGVPGKIQRFLKSIDKLNSADLGQNERHVKLQEIRAEFMQILELLENEQDKELFIEQVPEDIA